MPTTHAPSPAPTVWQALNASPASAQLLEFNLRYRPKTKMWEAHVALVGGAGGSAEGPVRDYVIKNALEGAECLAGHGDPAKLPQGVNPPGVATAHAPWVAAESTLPKVGDRIALLDPEVDDEGARAGRVWFTWPGSRTHRGEADTVTGMMHRGFARLEGPGPDEGRIVPYKWLDTSKADDAGTEG